MPVPSPRNKILPARGNYADLLANVASILEGEMCYAIDQDQYYQKEGGVLVAVGATWTEGTNQLYPADAGNDVLIGGTLPSSPNITLASGGEITAGTYNTLTVGLGGGSVSGNTAIGLNALESNTTGIYNTAVGATALQSNTIGIDNNALGRDTLFNNTIGSDNNAIGRAALYLNTEGDANAALGRATLFNNTTGNNNTAVGHQALYSSTGSQNAALGFRSGYYIEGSNNTILGAYQGTAADATLSDTVIISAGATERMRIDSTGNSNFTIPTLTNNTNGDVLLFRDIDTNTVGAGLRLARYQNAQNYGLGIYTSQGSNVEAVRVANTGDVLIGGTLPSAPNITLAAGGEITALADATINDLTVGRGSGAIASNTAVGSGALAVNTTGSPNVAIGRLALSENTEGSNNTATGYLALRVNTTGNNNTACGTAAMQTNATGSTNTAIGRQALSGNIAGNRNVALGYQSGFYIEGSSNTILGATTGTPADSTLNDTVIISAGAAERARCHSTGIWNLGTSAPVYADNAAAKTGGLIDGDVYRKSDGTLMIVFT